MANLAPLLKIAQAPPITAAMVRALTQTAAQRAAADTQAQVDAIRAQQAQIQADYAQRAGQTTQAASAAARLLQSFGLGNAAARDYADAAAAERAAAAGYSGGLQQTVGNAAADVQRNLAAIGSPQAAPNQGAAAGNALYGLGGNLPAATLDVVGPTVAASLRALPAQTLAYGQAQAQGLRGAGLQAAQKLTPDILAAQAKQSTLAANYLDKLQSAALAAGKVQFANVLGVLKAQQAADALDATQAWRDATLKRDYASINAGIRKTNATIKAENARAAASVAAQNARADAANRTRVALANQQAAALAAYRNGQLTLGEYNAVTRRIAAKKPPAPKVGAPPKGYRYNPATNRYEKVPGLPPAATTAGGGLSAASTTSFLKGLATTKRVPALDANGNTQLDANGKVKYTTQTQFRLPYVQAYRQLRQSGKSDKAARKALDTVYPKGQGGRSWLTNEQQAVLGKTPQGAQTGTIDIANVGERAYITYFQAAALRKAGKLPAGFWYTADQGHVVYVIKPGY